MAKQLTRSTLIQGWFVVVAVAIAAGVVLGASINVGTAAVLVALCFGPPTVVLMLWPKEQAASVSDVLHGVDRSL